MIEMRYVDIRCGICKKTKTNKGAEYTDYDCNKIICADCLKENDND